LGDGIPCLRLGDGTNPATVLDGIDGIIQDPAAGLVTMYADPPPGVRVLDLCAAPGGKALVLAAGGHPLLAGDRSLVRLGLLRENAARLRLSVDLMVADARRPPVTGGDFVLLDVPCSGTGTLRRHPDARWRLREETVVSLASLQKEILSGVRRLIPKGGHLVYSTCTLEEEENWLQVEGFLRENPGFRVEETGKVPESFITEEGFLQVLPQDSGFDGSFAARLVRKR
jgi:16S rRNA (cytosine967-C5)-methyltransferase